MKKIKRFSKRCLFLVLCAVTCLSLLPISSMQALSVETSSNVTLDGALVWEDEDDVDGLRPEMVEVNLYANDILVMSQMSEAPNWNYSFDISDGIKGFASLEGIKFTVSHSPIAEYTTTNVVHPTVSFMAPSSWEKHSSNNKLDIAYDTQENLPIVASKMTKDGVVVIWSQTPLAGIEEDTVIQSLETYANGIGNPKRYVFLSGEGASSKYGITITANQIIYENKRDWSLLFVGNYYQGKASASSITNTHTVQKVSLSVNKVWEDEENRDGKRPENVIVRLYANEIPTDKTVELYEENNWSASFENVDKKRNGIDIVYSILEEEASTDYASRTVVNDTEFTIYNTYAVEKISIPVKKIWNDYENVDGLRPDKIVVGLYQQNAKVSELILTEAMGWVGNFTNLYKYENGKVIDYTIQEENVIEGYTQSVDGYTITNTHERNMLDKELVITKKWDDQENKEHQRPKFVTVQLYKNDQLFGDEITLREEDNWTHTLNVQILESEQDIKWTVVENKIPAGYKAEYDTATLTITNVYTHENVVDIPDTSASANLWIWYGLLAVGGIGLMTLAIIKRKNS